MRCDTLRQREQRKNKNTLLELSLPLQLQVLRDRWVPDKLSSYSPHVARDISCGASAKDIESKSVSGYFCTASRSQ